MVPEVSFGAHLDEVDVKDERRRAEQIIAGIDGGISLFDVCDHSGYRQWEPMSRLLYTVRMRWSFHFAPYGTAARFWMR